MEADDKDTRLAITFFVDLVGSSSVSSEMNVNDYWSKYVRPFYLAIERTFDLYCNSTKFPEGYDPFRYLRRKPVHESVGIHHYATYRGDELVGFLLFPHSTEWDSAEVQGGLQEIVRALFVLKMYWLASSYNLDRVRNGQRPRDISAGIHIGEIRLVKDPKEPPNALEVGYAINLAKRVEGASRSGESSNIFATGDVHSVFEEYYNARKQNALDKPVTELFDILRFTKLRPGATDDFKGIDPPPDICELDFHPLVLLEAFESLHKDQFKPSRDILTGILGDFLTKTAKEHGNERIAKWETSDDIITPDSEGLDKLRGSIFSRSNLWFQAAATLLLLSCKCEEGKVNNVLKRFRSNLARRYHREYTELKRLRTRGSEGREITWKDINDLEWELGH